MPFIKRTLCICPLFCSYDDLIKRSFPCHIYRSRFFQNKKYSIKSVCMAESNVKNPYMKAFSHTGFVSAYT